MLIRPGADGRGAPEVTEPAPAGDPVAIYHAVCESITIGVMLIGDGGRIETLNPAASKLLGLDREDVLHRNFAEVFFGDESFDELNETILAAIQRGAVGHQRVATVSVGGRAVPLAVDTSYLRVQDSDGGARRGVVAVFNDISELESLRAKEIALAKNVEAKHRELQDAYRGLEERNDRLVGLLRKVRALRFAAFVCGGVLVAGLGPGCGPNPPSALFTAAPEAASAAPGGTSLFTVQPGPIASTITVASAIEPLREVAVTSPVEGQGRDGSRQARRERCRRAAAAGARCERSPHSAPEGAGGLAQGGGAAAHAGRLGERSGGVEGEADRDEGPDRAGDIQHQACGNRVPVEQGLAPAARQEAAEREHRTRLLDLESAEQDLNAVLAKGRQDREIVRLELENARSDLERVEDILRQATVAAPVAGVVLRLGTGSGPRGASCGRGTEVEAGEPLVTVGDMRGITASGQVDEVTVRRIGPGDAVRISGPAFPGIVLEGRVAYVSSQAFRPPGQRSLPVFGIAATVEKLDEAQRQAVRIGMSAEMEVLVYENDRALVVPVGAVDLSRGSRACACATRKRGTSASSRS